MLAEKKAPTTKKLRNMGTAVGPGRGRESGRGEEGVWDGLGLEYFCCKVI